MRNIAFIFILVFLVSCEKKEKPITLPAKGEGKVMQVDMGENYDYQYFVSLEENRIVHIGKTDSWDLAFQSGSKQDRIFLNGGKGMACYNTGKTQFDQVSYSDTLKAKSSWTYDSPSGEDDSSAIGNWKVNKEIYLIRLNESATKVRKLQIISEDAFQYVIAVGDIASNVPITLIIVKNPNCNFTYFSFEKLVIVEDVEPYKESWDLQFTRYNYTFYDQNPVLRYVVTGVLLNPSQTLAYKDSLNDYNLIKENLATSVPLSSKRDAIGFDWKSFSGAGGGGGNIWAINKNYNYIIKNQHQHFFKLHFLDFYSLTGVKGSPKFEFFQLK